jgi:WD40 repeat protein
MALSPDGRIAATGCLNGSVVRIWDAHSGAALRDLPLGHSRVAFSPDGRTLLTTSNGVELWTTDDWRPLWKGAGTHLSAHAFSPESRLVAVDAGAGQITIHEVAGGRMIARLNDPYPAALHTLAIGPGGKYLAGITRDLQQLFVWDLESVAGRLTELGIDCALHSDRPADAVAGSSLALDIRLEDPEARLVDELTQRRDELQDRPGDVLLHLQIGRLLTRLGRDREALSALVAAVESGAALAAVLEQAACEARLAHWAEALAVLERTLAGPSLAPAQQGLVCNALAWYLCLAPPEFRNPQRALECAHRALELEPANLAYVNTLGLALYRQQELPLAIEALKLSLHGSSQPVFDLYGLALCQQAAGDARLAAEFATRAEYLFETHGTEWSRQEQIEMKWLRDEYRRGVRRTDAEARL